MISNVVKILFVLPFVVHGAVLADGTADGAWGGPTTGAVQITMAVISLVGTIFMGYITYLIAKLNTKAADAATATENVAYKVEQVSSVLETNTKDARTEMSRLKDITDKTHAAVNGSMGHQLKMHMDMAEELAELRQTPQAFEKAKVARDLWESHEASRLVSEKTGDV